ncbi:cytochrome b/b6 domain-containing protein [Siccirubricoccus sp. KC 17139]|uniref:Cytochrome b/b6 domain-containing protein n=1 Tax=Siccirubricoccus soli TaxID=2899147 RepID=A0ABT1DF71_9PROT|nr:cytochrome b/b6 domain-containing protein [Siccirubricoccus soli]MCO6419860.1 cytochrome b/b6 domain-containing protein [Siccirubricoccus soli]MCP2685995.1 cytochrome b/b6 domain-containing protein [Siccirubricoccus soli]
MAEGAEGRAEAVRPVKVWDGWVRLCHWAIVALLGLSWWSAETGRMQLHFLSGYAVLALVLFRLAWGLVGSETARFSRFLRSPLAALRHLAGFRRGEPDREVGHNAAGGWMVLVLLGLLLAQPVTGLFADSGYGDYGPLAKRVASGTSDRLTGLHHRIFLLIQLAALLHVLAVVAYAVVKRHDLVRPMVTGWKRLPAGLAAPRLGSPVLALLLLAAAAAVVFGVSRLG